MEVPRRSGEDRDRIAVWPVTAKLAAPLKGLGTAARALAISARPDGVGVAVAETGRTRDRVASSGTHTSLQTSRLAWAVRVTLVSAWAPAGTWIRVGNITCSE